MIFRSQYAGGFRPEVLNHQGEGKSQALGNELTWTKLTSIIYKTVLGSLTVTEVFQTFAGDLLA